ncbi:MAG: TRAP transporter substrate-binding protein [Alphaproteobacteria bacterium]|nr:TRAP transporter substrate-binding protein [Alphaproteobacteria bacterium]
MIRNLPRRGALTIGAGTLAAACTRQTGNHWDLAQPWGPMEYHVVNARRFADEVAKATNGALIIHVHAGATLGIRGPDTMRAVDEGIVDMADASAFQQVGVEPILGLESLPYMVETFDELRVLYQIIREGINSAYARHNQRMVYVVPWPNQYFFTDREIATVADLKGLKIRTYDKLSTDLAHNLKMTPVQMPTTDVVASLAAGSLDAVMTSATTAWAQKYWDFLKFSIRANHTWSGVILSANQQSLDSLSAEHRDTFFALAQKLEPEFWDIAGRDDADKLKILEQNGMRTITPSPDLLAAMRAEASPVVKAYLNAVPEAVPLVRQFLDRVGRPMPAI